MVIHAVKPNIEKVLRGDQLAGAKLIRMLEEGDPGGIEGLKALYAHTGKAFVLGHKGVQSKVSNYHYKASEDKIFDW